VPVDASAAPTNSTKQEVMPMALSRSKGTAMPHQATRSLPEYKRPLSLATSNAYFFLGFGSSGSCKILASIPDAMSLKYSYIIGCALWLIQFKLNKFRV
jgi:hypothetical protein